MSKLMRSALRLRSRVGARHASWASSISTALELPSDIRRRVREEPLAATYDPQSVEAGWNEYWQQAITAKKREETQGRSTRDAKHFNMLLPPPNVTGALHIGHALTVTIQDALARWHLMRGYNVRWVPGLDHAGIATQSVVERKLAKEEGKSRHDLGREAFLDRVWEWNKQYGGRIMHQLDLLGTIVNKDETYFTLDETRSKAVVEAFVKLHERGLIFRKRRMVNWCPSLKTAISDIEVDSESLTGPTLVKVPGRLKPVEFGVMHRILYKVADSNEFLEVDTTRPETIFGDVAVAVHPDDPRYQRYHGMYVEHPFSGERIPIVVDDVLVNMELGTGVVKVTPAHDPKDYECGLRHNLPERFVINKDGRMCGNVPIQYAGMNRFDAREFVVDELKTRELYVSKLDHPTSISKCSRSGDIIEPLLMPQWFVDCRKMAERAVDNVRSGRLTIEPRSHEHMWYFFLENIQDWCVSRQLWWGHRIPAYRLDLPGHDDEWVVARSIDEARAKAIETFGDSAQHATINQDDDVLDTWFSSGLLPVSIAGWPEDDPVKSSVYPLSVMETGSDILFFWVARMAMLCEEFSGTVPFERILLHPMVRDKAGRKMSKSLGNVIDPIHVIQGISLDDLIAGLRTGNVGAQEMQRAEKELRKEFPNGIPPCGTDALRYALASYLQQGRQINMDIQRVVSHRQFCNKIWNAVRYALPLLNQDATTIKSSTQTLESLKADGRTGLAERWILSRLASTVEEVNKSMEANQLASSVAAFQRFFIQDLCDVYIEFSKPILYCNRINVEEFGSEYDVKQRQAAARLTLYTCLDFSMRLLHPFAPFVTEELWQRIRTYDPTRAAENDTSLLFATYPEAHHVSTWTDQHAEKEMNLILSVLHATRSLRHTVKTLAPNGANNADMQVYVRTSDSGESTVLLDGLRDLENQSRLRMNVVSEKCDALSSPTLCQSISQTCQVMIPVPGDSETLERARSEVQRLEKRLKKQTTALEGLTNRQSSPDYEAKVPEAIREQDTVRADQLRTDLDTTEASIRAIKQLELQYVV